MIIVTKHFYIKGNNFKRNSRWRNIRKLEKTIPANSNLVISNQLVDKIIEKEKKIDQMDIELNMINELIGIETNQKIKNKITIIDDINNDKVILK